MFQVTLFPESNRCLINVALVILQGPGRLSAVAGWDVTWGASWWRAISFSWTLHTESQMFRMKPQPHPLAEDTGISIYGPYSHRILFNAIFCHHTS